MPRGEPANPKNESEEARAINDYGHKGDSSGNNQQQRDLTSQSRKISTPTLTLGRGWVEDLCACLPQQDRRKSENSHRQSEVPNIIGTEKVCYEQCWHLQSEYVNQSCPRAVEWE